MSAALRRVCWPQRGEGEYLELRIPIEVRGALGEGCGTRLAAHIDCRVRATAHACSCAPPFAGLRRAARSYAAQRPSHNALGHGLVAPSGAMLPVAAGAPLRALLVPPPSPLFPGPAISASSAPGTRAPLAIVEPPPVQQPPRPLEVVHSAAYVTRQRCQQLQVGTWARGHSGACLLPWP